MKTFKEFLAEAKEETKKSREITPEYFKDGLDRALKNPDSDESSRDLSMLFSKRVIDNGEQWGTMDKFSAFSKWHREKTGKPMPPPPRPSRPKTRTHIFDAFGALHNKTHNRIDEAKVPTRMEVSNENTSPIIEVPRKKGGIFSYRELRQETATSYPKSIDGYSVKKGDNVWDLHKSRVAVVIHGGKVHAYDPHSAQSHGEALNFMGVNPKAVEHHVEIRKNRKGEVTVFRKRNEGESAKEAAAAETELANHPVLNAHLGTKFNVKTED